MRCWLITIALCLPQVAAAAENCPERDIWPLPQWASRASDWQKAYPAEVAALDEVPLAQRRPGIAGHPLNGVA